MLWGCKDPGEPKFPRAPTNRAPAETSPPTESFDRGPKKDAYGLMGVGWLWLVDPERRTVEAFLNVKGRMTPGPRSKVGERFTAPPFESMALRLEDLFL